MTSTGNPHFKTHFVASQEVSCDIVRTLYRPFKGQINVALFKYLSLEKIFHKINTHKNTMDI
jgi:hypothetical protein